MASYENLPSESCAAKALPFVVATLQACLSAGFRLHEVFDGEDSTRVETLEEALEAIYSVDESGVYFTHEHAPGKKFWVALILLNSEDVVSDYTAGDSPVYKAFSRAIDRGYDTAAKTTGYDQPEEPEAPKHRYTLEQIATELDRTAQAEAYYGNALYVAKYAPGVTDDDRALLERWLTGNQSGRDRFALQDLAIKLRQQKG